MAYVSTYFFFFNDTATTEIYTLSLHDALPIRELLPPASTIAVAHAWLLDPIGGIVRRCSLLEPEPELSQRMGEAPFFERFRPRIVFNGLSQELPLDRKPEGIGRLIPLAFSSSSFRGFERGEEGPADVGWAKLGRCIVGGVHELQVKKRRVAPLSVTVISSGCPAPDGRVYPHSSAATSRSTVPRSSIITVSGGHPCNRVNVLT